MDNEKKIPDSYEKAEGKTVQDIGVQLRKVYDEYPEYHPIGFWGMVYEFATDDFYNLHYVARKYLKLLKIMDEKHERMYCTRNTV